MGLLTAKMRKKLPASEFGIPGTHSYPMPDRAHAANAKARAAQQVGKTLTTAEKHHIDAKANRILYGQSKVKGVGGR